MSDPRKPDVVTVAVTRVDGGVTVLRVVTVEYGPGPNGTRIQHWAIDPTPAYVDRIIAKHDWQGPQAPVSWRFVPDDYVDEQTDRSFRNAWKDTHGQGKPDVDMDKAKAIHRDRLRAARTDLLEALDAEWMQADETNDLQAKALIRIEKQRLRDITNDPRIDAAQTTDDLKRIGVTP